MARAEDDWLEQAVGKVGDRPPAMAGMCCVEGSGLSSAGEVPSCSAPSCSAHRPSEEDGTKPSQKQVSPQDWYSLAEEFKKATPTWVKDSVFGLSQMQINASEAEEPEAAVTRGHDISVDAEAVQPRGCAPEKGTYKSPERRVANAHAGVGKEEPRSRDSSYDSAAATPPRQVAMNLEHATPEPFGPRRSRSAAETVKFEVGACYAVVPDRLYFTAHWDDEYTAAMIEHNANIFFFSTHAHECYEPFCSDFGPVNLAAVIDFCCRVHKKVTDPRLKTRPLVYYCSTEADKLTNMAFLLGAYLILCHGWQSENLDFHTRFDSDSSPFLQFRDATHAPSLWDLGLTACWKGVQRARDMGWIDVEQFDIEEYDMLQDPINGDLHHVSDKFIAFKGPHDDPVDDITYSPEFYVPILKEKEVEAVIRLNDCNTYDAKAFTRNGIRHYDLFFEDCTVPPQKVVAQFFEICERHKGVIAVHCLAGLGRTGTLIALWLMRHNGFKAADAIAWLRIARPGSVIGLQQLFLQNFDSFDWSKLQLEESHHNPEFDSPALPPAKMMTRSISAGELNQRGISTRRLSMQLAQQVKDGVAAKARRGSGGTS